MASTGFLLYVRPVHADMIGNLGTYCFGEELLGIVARHIQLKQEFHD